MSKKLSEATRRKISAKASGTKNAFYGKSHTSAWLKRESSAKSGRKNPMYGKKHSAATIRKIREAMRKRLSKKR